MRTGVFGGTFDPVHTGHLILAETVRDQAGLDRVIFLPAERPPHKRRRVLTPANHRLTMLNLALQDTPELTVSDFEIRRGGVCYTIDTLDALQRESGFFGQTLHPIIGADSLAELHTWKSPDRLLKKYDILCVRRPNVPLDAVDSDMLSSVRILDAPLISVSSTEIRARVKEGRSIRFWVPERVAAYIRDRGLYR